MATENLYQKDCIRTHSGIYMNVFEPKAEMVAIEDIAISLSRMPRFAGHLSEPYSVAEHSWLCCGMASIERKKEALLHDASEAYLMDIPAPIKKRLGNYKKIEDGLMRVIAAKFGFEYPLSEEVKKIDKLMMEKEWDVLMLEKKRNVAFVCFPPKDAEEIFLETFYKLEKKKGNSR